MPQIMDNTTVDGTVTADGFIGPLTGNVTGDCSGTAGRATADASGNTITTTYATKSELSGKQDALGTVGTDTKPIKVVDGVAVAVTNDLVSTAGNQTIGGLKTFSEAVLASGGIWTPAMELRPGPAPYIDFLRSTSASSDFSQRIMSDADGQLTITSKTDADTAPVYFSVKSQVGGTVISNGSSLTNTTYMDGSTAVSLISLENSQTHYKARLIMTVSPNNTVGIALQKIDNNGNWVAERLLASF